MSVKRYKRQPEDREELVKLLEEVLSLRKDYLRNEKERPQLNVTSFPPLTEVITTVGDTNKEKKKTDFPSTKKKKQEKSCYIDTFKKDTGCYTPSDAGCYTPSDAGCYTPSDAGCYTPSTEPSLKTSYEPFLTSGEDSEFSGGTDSSIETYVDEEEDEGDVVIPPPLSPSSNGYRSQGSSKGDQVSNLFLNQRFQEAVEGLRSMDEMASVDLKMEINKKIVDITRDFLEASSTVGKLIISERYLPVFFFFSSSISRELFVMTHGIPHSCASIRPSHIFNNTYEKKLGRQKSD
eukprot:TRINITY_DN5587_c0_g3_i1.p1 TRINITY_DN5587_c0_g3~~TRINITY_DN5587_c0_g3_i1.p1  ORF type:complete len:292 (-),score=58.32 TRINITY_DN5587_c0_g3_i1:194-1069(-)